MEVYDNDLINRQKVIDALDSINCFGYVEETWKHVQTIIELIPSVQPEVIQCKDCKHWNELLCQCNRRKPPLLLFGANDFCSKAERRTDE